jgi:hypothetical protein
VNVAGGYPNNEREFVCFEQWCKHAATMPSCLPKSTLSSLHGCDGDSTESSTTLDGTATVVPASHIRHLRPLRNASTIVRELTDHLIGDTTDAHKMQEWGYGQSIIVDAMLLAEEKIDGMNDVMSRWVNPILDKFLATEGSAA